MVMGYGILNTPNSTYDYKIKYEGATTAAGNVLGTTLVCDPLNLYPSLIGCTVQIMNGAARYCERIISVHPAGGNTITVADPFTDNAGAVAQITAGTHFVVKELGGGASPAPPLLPSIGLWMFGECDATMAASLNTLVCSNLAGFPDDIFNNEFWVQVIHNTSAPGTVPEREIRRITDYAGATGTFTTDNFSANVEAGDLLAVFHDSILTIEILGYGTLDFSSATVPADSTRGEGNNYFNGCLLMPTEGACAFQPRPVVDYTGATGVFTIDPNNPFTAATGLVDYIIIRGEFPQVATADGANNYTPYDVIGNKADVRSRVAGTASIVALLREAIEGGKGLDAIFDLVNADLTLQELSNTLTATGGEDTVYEELTPAGVLKAGTFAINLDNMAAGDVTVLRVYYQTLTGGALAVRYYNSYAGADGGLAGNRTEVSIALDPNRFGFRITLEQTAGTNRDYPWAIYPEV